MDNGTEPVNKNGSIDKDDNSSFQDNNSASRSPSNSMSPMKETIESIKTKANGKKERNTHVNGNKKAMIKAKNTISLGSIMNQKKEIDLNEDDTDKDENDLMKSLVSKINYKYEESIRSQIEENNKSKPNSNNLDQNTENDLKDETDFLDNYIEERQSKMDRIDSKKNHVSWSDPKSDSTNKKSNVLCKINKEYIMDLNISSDDFKSYHI